MITGRTWSFGDNINTDLMVPSEVTYASEAEQLKALFQANRPGWIDEVRKGDILVGGRNFGMGSSRPAARSLRNAGLACMLAETLNGLFFRNAVNFGFLALQAPGVHDLLPEGATAEVDIAGLTVRNSETGESLAIKPVPANLLALMQGGGVFPHLEERGLIAPRSSD